MRCVCGQRVLQVITAPSQMPSLLDAEIHPCGIWTVDAKGAGGRLTVRDVWDGVRGHHEHLCQARQEGQPGLFEIVD